MVNFANLARFGAQNRGSLAPLNNQPENASFEKDPKEATAADPASFTVSITGFVFLRFA